MKKMVAFKGIFILLVLSASFLYSCKKGPGEGGRASIKGKIYTVNYNAALTIPQDSGYLGGQNVYIIYGDEVGVGDSQDSNNEGAFEFKYLRKGHYKVYVFTKTQTNHIDTAVVQEVEITDRKQVVELPDFRVKSSKN